MAGARWPAEATVKLTFKDKARAALEGVALGLAASFTIWAFATIWK